MSIGVEMTFESVKTLRKYLVAHNVKVKSTTLSNLNGIGIDRGNYNIARHPQGWYEVLQVR